jgi:hypothetical protein
MSRASGDITEEASCKSEGGEDHGYDCKALHDDVHDISLQAAAEERSKDGMQRRTCLVMPRLIMDRQLSCNDFNCDFQSKRGAFGRNGHDEKKCQEVLTCSRFE